MPHPAKNRFSQPSSPLSAARLRSVALLALIALLGLAGVGAGATASTRARLASNAQWGISDDSPTVFTDPRFTWLHMRIARVIVAWDVMYRHSEMIWRDRWLQAAHAAHVKPLVVFSADPKHPKWLPSTYDYGRAVRLFMKRYPWVHDYTPWDEENHYIQPTARDPKRAAEYYNLIASACGAACAITAADVLDEANMAWWVERFLRYANHPHIWGLHNYLDLNHGGHGQTSLLLKMVHGEVWFTETGGLVWRYERGSHTYLVRGDQYAARAASRLLALAAISKRITRVYYYQWRVPVSLAWVKRHHGITWDSGLISPDCKVRLAFDVIARVLGQNPAHAPRVKHDAGGDCVGLATKKPVPPTPVSLTQETPTSPPTANSPPTGQVGTATG